MKTLYPLKFKSIFKEKIWGGNKIRDVLEKDSAPDRCGESWEISGVEGDVSVVQAGELKGSSLNDLIRVYGSDLLGSEIYKIYGHEFPLLIKFLDANEDLSIQVHPDDELAQKRHQSSGKTEMWYVIQADRNAKLISGFKTQTNTQEFIEKVENGQLMDILNLEQVVDGDTFYIPAGRVHTIGKGLLVAEIQQTSDVTYRIYDFDRTDVEGNKRELHIEQALEAIDFAELDHSKVPYSSQPNAVNPLVKSRFFTTNQLVLDKEYRRDYRDLDSFKIIICTEGAVSMTWNGIKTPLKKGETCLLPAVCKDMEMSPNPHVVLLETYIA
ncbi:MAG: type I phosphomannose isomerase catalytic subunit [Bacteroidota bacterium]